MLIFSIPPLEQLSISVDVFNSPVITLNIDNFPINGSIIVLNTLAENFSSLQVFLRLSLISTIGLGDGKILLIHWINKFIPKHLVELPHMTGIISPEIIPFLKPKYISSFDKVPTSKYLFSKFSSLSATNSIIFSLYLIILFEVSLSMPYTELLASNIFRTSVKFSSTPSG